MLPAKGDAVDGIVLEIDVPDDPEAARAALPRLVQARFGDARPDYDASYRFQTRAALPHTMRSRSSSGTPTNCASTSSRDLGQLDTGCG